MHQEYLHILVNIGFSKLDAPKQWVGRAAYIEEVLCVLYNGVRKRPRVRPVSPAHLVNILVTAVSWLSIIVVGGGVSSLLRDKHSEPVRQ